MNRQELIEDFWHFLKEHREEVQSHICQPPYDFLDEDDWDDQPKSVTINGSKTPKII